MGLRTVMPHCNGIRTRLTHTSVCCWRPMSCLAARSGAWSADDYRENLALTAAMLDHRGGRSWRPLEDTAVAAQLLYFAPESWAGLRRGTDFYPEGTLVWLAVDTLIRQQSEGR